MMQRLRIPEHTLRFLAVLLLLLLVRLPFFLTQHIQEDAYISLRCAVNLAETGVYGFNPGERVSASTSHAYVFLTAFIRLIAGEAAFVPVVQVVNTLLFLCGTYFISSMFIPQLDKRTVVWVIVSLLPVSLMISYSGMETSLLIFVLGLAFYLLQNHRQSGFAWLPLAVIPWIRPDAVAYALIIVVWQWLREKRFSFTPILAVLIGTAALLAFNQLYFGSLLNQSILAKGASQSSFTLTRFITDLRLVFAEYVGGVFNPIRTKYLSDLGYLFLILVSLGIALYLWHQRRNRDVFLFALALTLMIFSIPAAYAFGSVIFPWYVWPCTLFAYAILAALVDTRISAGGCSAKWIVGAVIIVLVMMLVLQWAYSYNWGTKERAYRGRIGVFLGEISEQGDTLFLEPAGYIPYYAGLYTYDEVGLVSPVILEYRSDDPQGWWMDFVKQVKPTWLVQRGHITDYRTYQGYAFSAEERDWFNENYTLVSSFTYEPADYTESTLLMNVLDLGAAEDYYIYKLNR